MIWLILQMLTCLALAAALGGLLGWWLRGLGLEDRRRHEIVAWERRLADYRRQLEECSADCQTLAERLAACEARSAELERQLAEALAARAAASPPVEEPAPDGPQAGTERYVVTGRKVTEDEEPWPD